MKNILCIALCVMMVVSLLAGCGLQQPAPTSASQHSHTWIDTWTTSESHHWKNCSGCAMRTMVGTHMDDDLDGVCNNCGYAESCEHTFDEERWMSDAENHWHPATCKHKAVTNGKTGHVDAENDGVCDVCQYLDAAHQHTYEQEWSANESGHWHEASCGHNLVADKGVHVDAENDGVCDVCQYLDAAHQHTYEQEWSANESGHWHEANCGHSLVSDKAAHEDPENDGACNVCGWLDRTHTHTYENGWSRDAGYHWHGATCQHTGETKDRALHADLDGDDYCDTCKYEMCHHVDFDVDGICDICGFKDPNHAHTYMNEWISNHTGHWKAAQCHPGAITQVEAHADKNNDGTCDICAYVICIHVYKEIWSSNDTHHWYQLMCTCSVETRKNYGEHVDEDGVPGCDICMRGCQVVSSVETIIDKQNVTITPSEMITWTAVTINIPKPGRYLITSDNVEVRWYLSKDQENEPTSYASEVYFEEAGEVTILANYFDFEYEKKSPFDIKLTVILIGDLVLNSNRGKVELPANMLYKVVFEAMEVGTWTLRTSVANVAMGVTVDEMQLATGVEISVEKPGDLVELYVLLQDDNNNNGKFLFDWELVEPFQLNVGLGQSTVSVPAEGDDYKVVFTAPEDGCFLLMVTNKYLSFSEWGLGGFDAPVRTESTQQLTPEMKAGETFTTWIQTVYNYAQSVNVNDTLTIINVGTLLGNSPAISETPLAELDFYLEQAYYAEENGKVNISLTNGQIGMVEGDGIIWKDSQIQKDMEAGEYIIYYVRPMVHDKPVVQNISFVNAENVAITEEIMLSEQEIYGELIYTAQDEGKVSLSVFDGQIGIRNEEDEIVWMQAGKVDGQMVCQLTQMLKAGESIYYYVRPLTNDRQMMQTVSTYRACHTSAEGNRYSFTAKEDTYYHISVMGGEIGITTNGVTQWIAPKDVGGQMIASYEVRMEAGDTYVFQIRGQDGSVFAAVWPVYYEIDMNEMFNSEANDMAQMGKNYTVNMVPGKVYTISVPDALMKLRVKLSWKYKGVAVYVDGKPYQMGTEIFLQDVKSITAKLQNNVAVDVVFTMTVTYVPVQQEAVTEGNLALNKDMLFLVTVGGQAKATYTAEVGGTYILTNFTSGARIYVVNELGQIGELVISDGDSYSFQLEADETVQFIILSDDGHELLVQVTLAAPRP